MTVLVIGGAGYIGSHMVGYLLDHGRDCVVLDNLSTGFSDSVPNKVPFYQGDLADNTILDRIFENHDIRKFIKINYIEMKL